MATNYPMCVKIHVSGKKANLTESWCGNPAQYMSLLRQLSARFPKMTLLKGGEWVVVGK